MKITKQYLTQVIKEELQKLLIKEFWDGSYGEINFNKESKEDIKKTLEKMIEAKLRDEGTDFIMDYHPEFGSSLMEFEVEIDYEGIFDASKKPDFIEFRLPDGFAKADVVGMDDKPASDRSPQKAIFTINITETDSN